MTTHLVNPFFDDPASQSARVTSAPTWVLPRPEFDVDIAIVGAGQSGVAIAFALRRQGIRRIAVFEAAPDESTSGPWGTIARMRNLRSNKYRSTVDLGVPGLSFRHWYEGRFGAMEFEFLEHISLTHWIDYLAWYRRTTGIEVLYGHRLVDVGPFPAGVELVFETERGGKSVRARRVVLATGYAGLGGPNLPEGLFSSLPSHLYAHTESGSINFSDLRGKRVGVLGAASAAFDAAATALESGAAEVHLFSRHAKIHVEQLDVQLERHLGARQYFWDLPDELRWRYTEASRNVQTVEPQTVERAQRFANFHTHLNAAWKRPVVDNGAVRVEAGKRIFHLDFVIAGTGYKTDLALRPELGQVAPHVLLWKDKFHAESQLYQFWKRSPYLGPGFEFQEREPGAASFVTRIHAFSNGATLSFGSFVGTIAYMNVGVPRLVSEIARRIFREDAAQQVEGFIGALYDSVSHPAPSRRVQQRVTFSGRM